MRVGTCIISRTPLYFDASTYTHSRKSRSICQSRKPFQRFDLNKMGEAARHEIAALVESLARSNRENPRLRVVIAGATLSAETISTLITALRKFRELGGAIELRGESDGVRAVIMLNGLDRVFAFPLLPEDEANQPRRLPRKRNGIGRAVRAAAAMLAFLTACRVWLLRPVPLWPTPPIPT